MINTFFGSGSLNTPIAFLASLIIGIAFGFSLEQAGFGSSRRLAGIFYFKDMAVLKVMFTAVVVAMLGISYAKGLGFVTTDNVFFMHTSYLPQILGGLLFGAGFVMSGWCPGTAAVGLASVKVDALVFLLGAIGGSMIYNEVFPLIKPFASVDHGLLFAYDSMKMSEAAFAMLFTIIAVGCFWGSEYIEKNRSGGGKLFGTRFLKIFSVVLIVVSFGLFAVAPQSSQTDVVDYSKISEGAFLDNIEDGMDHMSTEELADRLVEGDKSIILVDIRPPQEFDKFNIKTSVNIKMSELQTALLPYKDQGTIVLYSNGMTHPAQARDSLVRTGFKNVYILTDGLNGFVETCLKPASLHQEPLTQEMKEKISAWRKFFR